MTDAASPIGHRARRFRARDAIVCTLVAALLLVLFGGSAIREQGEEMDPGFTRSVVLAVGEPAGAIADALPFASAARDATAWLSPDDDLGDEGSFATAPVAAGGTAARDAVAPVGPEAFDPRDLGAPPPARGPLRTLLVTGDSMSMPLDAELARRLAGAGVRTVRDPHIGTGISKDDLLDWGALSLKQTRDEQPDAVVVFIGANEGFPLPGADGREVECCGPEWAALYATRVRRMMDTYRRDGAARVYWLKLPAPRDPDLARIARAVNAAIEAAAAPYRAQVRVVELDELFTPGWRFRNAMEVDGQETIVREPDGIHLNDAGARLAADVVEERLGADFALSASG
ncbi:MAG TPA: GDSL-type esterase/lipase family protein [Capillimicrobium sp.]|nr:GDSL-type esterase/lipase family protein [Capillimicrobium sp.]